MRYGPEPLYSLLRLPWLAPDIATAIINGRKPPQLTAQTLMRLTPRLPADWAEQRKLLGSENKSRLALNFHRRKELPLRMERHCRRIVDSASSRLQSIRLRLTSAAP